MITNGEPLPEAIVIQLPKSVLISLTNQYATTGIPDEDNTGTNPAKRAAIYHIDRVIRKYISAGTPYILIDEDGLSYEGWQLFMETYNVPVPTGAS
jgi:hypothetical protein